MWLPVETKKRQCKVLFEYIPQNEDELELKVGDIIDISEEVSKNIWFQIESQSSVFVPFSLLISYYFWSFVTNGFQAIILPKLNGCDFLSGLERAPLEPFSTLQPLQPESSL